MLQPHPKTSAGRANELRLGSNAGSANSAGAHLSEAVMKQRSLVALVVLAILTLTFGPTTVLADPLFGANTDFATGTNPIPVAIGDLNGDGKPDLAVANYYSNTVSVLLGNGDGTFGAKTDFGTGSIPFSVAIGDLNGGRQARPGDGERRRQHGLGAARQRRRDLRGEDRLRDGGPSPLRGDRGPERGREARPGGGELRLQHGVGAARQRRRDLRGEDGLRDGEPSPPPWRSGT